MPARQGDGAADMKITLTRTVPVRRYSILGTLKVRENRSDIQTLLEQVCSGGGNTPRLRGYLEGLGLLEKDGTVSFEGEKVIETGTLSSKERGLYSAWYVEGDKLLGTRPILMQRVEGGDASSWKGLQKGSARSLFGMEGPVWLQFVEKDKKTVVHEVERFSPEALGVSDGSAELTLTWIVSPNENTSQVRLGGSLSTATKVNTKKSQGQSHPFEMQVVAGQDKIPSLLEEIASNLGHSWNANRKRAETDVPDNCSVIERFSYVRKELRDISFAFCGLFKKVHLEDYPLMPKSVEVANAWHKSWLVGKLSESFTSEASALVLQKRYLFHPAMKPFSLSPLHGSGLYDILDRNQSPVAFWHTMAMQDLLPTRGKTHLSPLTLTGKAFDMDELVCHLTRNEPVQRCIYSDRHYKTGKHAKNLNVIQQALNAEQGLVLTNADELPQVPKGWSIESIKKSSENHDRYWVFQTNAQNFYWKCTTSLDFFSVQNGRYHLQESNPTFVPLDEDEVPAFILESIEKAQGEAA